MSWNRIRDLALLSLLGLVLATPPVLAGEENTEEEASEAPDEPVLLWKLEGEEQDVWLYGSVHLLTEDHYPLPEKVDDAFEGSRHLVVETDTLNIDPQVQQELVVNKAMLPADRSLEDVMGEEDYARAREILEELGYDIAQLEGVRPWFIALTISVSELQKLGYTEEYGIETHFLERAGDRGLAIHELESFREQLEIFDGLPEEQQVRFLMQSLEEAKDLEPHIETLLNAWEEGDLATLEEVLQESFAEYPELYDRIIVNRNQAWVPQIEEFLEREHEQDYFVIVGALHLVGEDSVLRMLEDRGWEPQRQ